MIAGCGGGASSTRERSVDTVATPLRTSTIPGYTEYYRTMRYNAVGRIVFCNPTVDPRSEADVFAVSRDLAGRPTMVSRYFYGNIDTKTEWQTLRIDYTFYPSTATLVERRTYHDAVGAPKGVRGAHGQELLYKSDQITMRRLIDQAGKPLEGVRSVIRSLYREERPGTIVQEWFFGNGKQYRGIGTDEHGSPFADMPEGAYFRRFTVNVNGELVREEVWGIDKQAMPYPGGEIVRAYEHNDCGQITTIGYLDEQGRTRPNADGIAREALRHDAYGRVVEWRAFDESGAPRSRSEDSAAAIVFRYRDFDGVLLGIDRFDANGHALPPLYNEFIGRRPVQ